VRLAGPAATYRHTMTTWVCGTEESTIPATEGALPGRRGAQSSGAALQRQPAGTWHAIDADTGRPACGTSRLIETFPAIPWSSPEGTDRCAPCAARVPVSA
jgi:hypothetical protein